jgi:excisionase family DNA binding protein
MGLEMGSSNERDTEMDDSTPPQSRHFYTVSQIAERLQVNERTVRRWIKSGQLVAHRFDRAIRVAIPDLRAFLGVHRED